MTQLHALTLPRKLRGLLGCLAHGCCQRLWNTSSAQGNSLKSWENHHFFAGKHWKHHGIPGKKNWKKKKYSQNVWGIKNPDLREGVSFPSGILIQMFQMEASLQYELPKYSYELKVDMIS